MDITTIYITTTFDVTKVLYENQEKRVLSKVVGRMSERHALCEGTQFQLIPSHALCTWPQTMYPLLTIVA